MHRERLREFAGRFADARAALAAWAKAMEAGRFRHLVELRQAFRSADYVKPYVIFNIAGNKYRLAALINYGLEIASVERVMAHAEYNQGKWRR